MAWSDLNIGCLLIIFIKSPVIDTQKVTSKMKNCSPLMNNMTMIGQYKHDSYLILIFTNNTVVLQISHKLHYIEINIHQQNITPLQ